MSSTTSPVSQQVILSAKVPKSLAEEIHRRARDEERPVSQVIRRLLRAALTPAAEETVTR